MSAKTIYTCDQCGAEKKETNHWWTILKVGPSIAVAPMEYPLDRAVVGYPPEFHLCGQACVVAYVNAFLSDVVKGQGLNAPK